MTRALFLFVLLTVALSILAACSNDPAKYLAFSEKGRAIVVSEDGVEPAVAGMRVLP
jgi:hypothetical protein